jgi:tetratricopeptide (TPR) repeat protein
MKSRTIKNSLLALLFCPGIALAQPAKDAQSYYDQGIKLKEEKKPAEALEKFKQAIAINPKHTDALYQAGWCQNDLRNYNSAIDYLRRSGQSGVATPKLYFEMGYAFEKSSKDDSAIHYYNKCLELKPDYSNALKQLGFMAYYKDDYENALAKFNKYEQAAKSEITDYLYWYRKGFTYNALKQYANAKEPLQKSLTLKNDYINTHLELGFAATKLKQDEDAIGHFKAAMAIDPKSHIPYNGIAEVYRDNKKDMNEAMNWYKKTLAINPTERKACFGMGYCLNSQQKYADALSYLKTAVEKEPTYTAAYVELGYSYFKTGSDADAEKSFVKAIELNPKNENARFYACLMYIKQKNKTRAQKMLDELKTLSSKHVSTLQPKVDAL